MKIKLLGFLAIVWAAAPTHVFACATCMGAKDSPSTAHLAAAIWVMIGAITTVLGGVSAFGVHLWRHASIPLEPHQQLLAEDLEKYD